MNSKVIKVEISLAFEDTYDTYTMVYLLQYNWKPMIDKGSGRTNLNMHLYKDFLTSTISRKLLHVPMQLCSVLTYLQLAIYVN